MLASVHQRFLKAQAATEFLIMIGFVTVVSLPLLFLFLSQSQARSELTNLTYARSSVKLLSDAALEVYSQASFDNSGEEFASRTVNVFFPEGVTAITTKAGSIADSEHTSDNYVGFNIITTGGTNDVISPTIPFIALDSNPDRSVDPSTWSVCRSSSTNCRCNADPAKTCYPPGIHKIILKGVCEDVPVPPSPVDARLCYVVISHED